MFIRNHFNRCNDNLNPFSKAFKASLTDFGKLNWKRKTVVVISTIAFNILIFPIAIKIVCGFSPFRWTVKQLKSTEINKPKNETKKPKFVSYPTKNTGSGGEPKKVVKKNNEPPKKVEPPKKNEAPKKVEPPKKNEAPKKVEPPKKNEAPKKVEVLKKIPPVKQPPLKTTIENVKDVFKANFTNSADANKVVWKGKKYEEWNLQIFAAIQQNKENLKNLNWNFPELFVRLEELNELKQKYPSDPLLGFTEYDEYYRLVKGLTKDLVSATLQLVERLGTKLPALNYLCYIVCSCIKLENSSHMALTTFHNVDKIEQGKKELTELSFGENDDSFIRELNNLWDAINRAPQEFKTPKQMGLKNWWNGNSVSISDGNLPYVSYELELKDGSNLFAQNKTVKALRMGAITQSVWTGTGWKGFLYEEQFMPEFAGMLEVYKKEKKQHLTVFYGDIRKGNSGYNLIKDSSENEKKYKDTLHCIALSKESDFYNENKESVEAIDFTSFSKEIFQEFVNKDSRWSGIDIPVSVKKKLVKSEGEKFSDYVEKTISEIHEQFFDKKGKLTGKDRKKFIDVLYDTITKDALLCLEVDSFNIVKTNGIDTSVCASAQLYTHIAVTQNPTNKLTSSQKKKVAEILFVPSLNAVKDVLPKESYQGFVKVESVYLAFSKKKEEEKEKEEKSSPLFVFGGEENSTIGFSKLYSFDNKKVIAIKN